MLTTVAICTRNRAALMEKAVRSVLAQMGSDTELLIVDNGSSDETPELAKKIVAADPRVRFIVEKNSGISHARNAAVKDARGKWLLFLDDDATAEPSWLAAYENFFRNPPDEKAASVGGAVTPVFEIPLPKWVEKDVAKLDLGPKPFPFPYDHCPWECNYAVRCDAVNAVGGFGSPFGHIGQTTGYREGAELNLRLQDAGYETWWLPGAAIRHFMHAKRMNLRWLLSAAFNEGRSIALHRLKDRAGAGRFFYCAGRLLAAPFHMVVNLLVAAVSWPFQHGRPAVKALKRVMSVSGMATELFRRIKR
ncbi:MAG TPA: glycosyltransferase family 2 protein [Verrucomicrobiae bacterium]|nr:glycosyltransferase family 2 protein [Verrucomicrobiae bacterium]